MKIIQENEYLDTMKNEVEPYLKAHCREGYIPGAEDIYHEKNGIIGKIHVKRYLADDPKGVVVISHGFTEGAPKYEEMIYYFLQAGYHVYMPEHMGHGQSYRLTADPSLVHLEAVCKRFFESMPRNQKGIPEAAREPFGPLHGRCNRRNRRSLGTHSFS